MAQLSVDLTFVFLVLKLPHLLVRCFPLVDFVYLLLEVAFVLVFLGFPRVKLNFSNVLKVVRRLHVNYFVARGAVKSVFLLVRVWRGRSVHLKSPVLFHLRCEFIVLGKDVTLSVSDRCPASLLVAELVVGVVLLHVSKIKFSGFQLHLFLPLLRLHHLQLENIAVSINLLPSVWKDLLLLRGCAL